MARELLLIGVLVVGALTLVVLFGLFLNQLLSG
jgi:hypothetical protein